MTVYYVNQDTGSDANPGTKQAPWASYAPHINKMKPGDVIRIVKSAKPYADGFRATASGVAGGPITITVDDAKDPPLFTVRNPWIFAADHWVLDGLDFKGSPAHQISVGDATTGTWARGITVRNCQFRHTAQEAIEVRYTDTLRVDHCLFRDIRWRVAGRDKNAINLRNGARNVVITGCLFEDIGSDCVHGSEDTDNITDVLIENCIFRVNRPYGSVPWQDWGSSVGENGLDFKRTKGPITVRSCIFSGYQEIFPGQDCSDGSYKGISLGVAARVHMDAINVTFDGCLVYDCNQGLDTAAGLAEFTTAGMSVYNCTITKCSDAALVARRALRGLTAERNQLLDCGLYLYLYYSPVVFRNNTVRGGGYNRAPNGQPETFEANCWMGGASVPSAWRSPTDTTSANIRPVVFDFARFYDAAIAEQMVKQSGVPYGGPGEPPPPEPPPPEPPDVIQELTDVIEELRARASVLRTEASELDAQADSVEGMAIGLEEIDRKAEAVALGARWVADEL